MDRVEEWMQGGIQWNVVFLYTKDDDIAVSFVKMLQDSKDWYTFRGS